MNALKSRARMRGQGGFTLIELLIVIAILGILAGVVVYAVGGSTESAKKNACTTERDTIDTALEAYKADATTGAYPGDLASLTPKYLKRAAKTADWNYANGSVSPSAGKYNAVSTSCG